MIKYRLKLIRYGTCETLHKKALIDIKADAPRRIIVTIGDDHRINLYDLDDKK